MYIYTCSQEDMQTTVFHSDPEKGAVLFCIPFLGWNSFSDLDWGSAGKDQESIILK